MAIISLVAVIMINYYIIATYICIADFLNHAVVRRQHHIITIILVLEIHTAMAIVTGIVTGNNRIIDRPAPVSSTDIWRNHGTYRNNTLYRLFNSDRRQHITGCYYTIDPGFLIKHIGKTVLLLNNNLSAALHQRLIFLIDWRIWKHNFLSQTLLGNYHSNR